MFAKHFDHGVEVEDLACMNRKRVKVHINGDFENGRIFSMESHWDIDEFLNAVSNLLAIAATRVFNACGKELEDVMLAEENDVLFVSAGADFKFPEPMSSIKSQKNDWSRGAEEDDDASHLPITICGYHVSFQDDGE